MRTYGGYWILSLGNEAVFSHIRLVKLQDPPNCPLEGCLHFLFRIFLGSPPEVIAPHRTTTGIGAPKII